MPPHQHPEVSPGTAPALHCNSNPLQPQGEMAELEAALPSCSGPLGQMGWEGREPLESPQVRCQSALQTNLGLYIEPVLDPGPWLADVSNYQKASASTYMGEGKPLVPQRERQSRTVHDYLGKQFFSSWSPRACSRRWASLPEDGFRRARALGGTVLPSLPPNPAARSRGGWCLPLWRGPRGSPQPAHSEPSCWQRSQNCSQAFKGAT